MIDIVAAVKNDAQERAVKKLVETIGTKYCEILKETIPPHREKIRAMQRECNSYVYPLISLRMGDSRKIREYKFRTTGRADPLADVLFKVEWFILNNTIKYDKDAGGDTDA